jgi:hypothetical protein
MIKKLVIGGLIVAVVGVLGVGIYSYVQNNNGLGAGRALAQGNRDGQGYQGGRGSGLAVPGSDIDRGQGGFGGRIEGSVGRGGGNGGSRAAAGYGDGSGIPNPQAAVSEWLTLSGRVVSVETNTLTITSDDGRTLDIQLGPERFWSSQDVTLAPGDLVTIQAFEEDGQMQAGQITLDTQGTTLTLRDADGRPLWAGQGRGGRQ